jgi:hypothetical protein
MNEPICAIDSVRFDRQIEDQVGAYNSCDTCGEPDFDAGLLRKTQCQGCWETSCAQAFWDEFDKGEQGLLGSGGLNH